MRLVVIALALASSAAVAQEIGTEIASPQSAAAAAVPSPAARAVEPQAAHRRAWGLRAGFSNVAVPALSTAAGVPATTIGLKVFLAEHVALNVDAGLALGLSNGGTAFGFGLGAGADFYFGTARHGLRTFATAGVGVSKLLSTRGDDFALTGIGVGGGCEYSVSPSFALDGRLLVSLSPLFFAGDNQLVIATLSPSIGGTFYF